MATFLPISPIRRPEYREMLIETAIEQDDAAMEAYLEGNEPDAETLSKCIRMGTVSGKFVPVLCGTAFKNKGVQPLLDAVVDYMPAPTDVPPIKGVKAGTEERSSVRIPTTSRSRPWPSRSCPIRSSGR